MIQVYVENDYATDESLRMEYRRWLSHPMTQNVIRTLEYGARAHPKKLPDSDGARLVAFGEVRGAQLVIDKMQSLDSQAALSRIPEEDFDQPPTA